MHDTSILPNTLKFLYAASHLLATAEKKGQKIAAKPRFKQLKKRVERLSILAANKAESREKETTLKEGAIQKKELIELIQKVSAPACSIHL
uniref:Uncharacterized protein n=1 Tax=Ditylenchus dipsaci TaxID=166011 RepID=A0A915E0L1_9BILA